MDGDKLARVKQDSIDLINTLLSDTNNRAALITFETESQLVLPLTNNKEELIGTINNLTTGNTTNYYQALVNVDKILKDYKKEENRECIVLFLTDGYPNEDTPNEEGQYSYLKKQYPYVTINGVQYEMGSEVLTPVKKVSDQQFIADMTNLNNVLFEASVAPSTYNEFLITDYINDDYFEIDSVDNIVASVGTTRLEYEGSTPKVVWNIENLRSGLKAKLTIDVNLKREFLNTGGIYPTNRKEEIKTEMDKVKEDITSPKTPVLADNHRVIYDGNVPDGCAAKNIPETTTRSVFDTVEISTSEAVCEGYQFKGWTIVTDNVQRIGENHFTMPESDVVIRANWGKMDIAKGIDGEIYVAPPSIIMPVNQYQDTKLWKYKNTLTKIVFENSISDKNNAIETFDISALQNDSVVAHIIQNEDDSTYTAYIQGNKKVIANEKSSYLFYQFSKLVSIEGLEYFDTSEVTNMEGMFYDCNSLTGLDLGNFDTSEVTNMEDMFYDCNSLTSLNLSNFNTSKVTNMSHMFVRCSNIKNIVLSSFDTNQVKDMSHMFHECRNLTNLDLKHFDTSKVTDMSYMFYSCSSLTSLDLSNFDTSQVTNMNYMFSESRNLTSLDLSNFDTSKVTTMYSMFGHCENLISLDLSSFNTSNVTSMYYMFIYCNSLAKLDLSTFDTSKVINMSGMFYGCSNLESLDISNFDTSQVRDMSQMFRNCPKLTTSITIMNKITSYKDMFPFAATSATSKITVNYTTETSDLVDKMIQTKSSNSNVVKGELVS